MNTKLKRWVIPGTQDYDEGAVLELVDDLKSMGFNEEEEFGIRLSLNEAIINGIQHGNKNDTSKSVVLEYRSGPDKIEFVIADEGAGFEYSTIRDPTDPDNLTKEHGRGIFLMQNYMDELNFSDRGSKVTLVKYIKKDERRG